jgi:hypothetical protein
MYNEGDYIPGRGTVTTNHCGLPWLCGLHGEYCGVVQVSGQLANGDAILCDAISGELLTTEEINLRLNNYDFDYEHKSRNCQNWRKKNQPYGPYYFKASKFTKFKMRIKNRLKNIIKGGSKV